jgi:hypothetical protein
MLTVRRMETVATPAKRALAVLDNPPQTPATDLPPRRISKKVRAVIGYMVNGQCKQIGEAAAKVGLARESLSRALSQPHVAEHLRQRVLRHLAPSSTTNERLNLRIPLIDVGGIEGAQIDPKFG